MSFSSEIKEELSKNIRGARHCQVVEIASLISFCGKIVSDGQGHIFIKLASENIFVSRKYFTLLKKAFNIVADISVRTSSHGKTRQYYVTVTDQKQVHLVLSAIKLIKGNNEALGDLTKINGMLIMNTCCKRAFLRGAFLAAGSIGDPNKAYHLEIVTTSEKKGEQLLEVIREFDIDAKMVTRKSNHVVYIKEGSAIVEFLNVIEAHVALMEFENVRIVKEMRNSVNRQVNCETANINKTITASVKQIEDIQLIRDTVGLDSLSDNLKQMAEIRLKFPDTALGELGKHMTPALGKSGVNHRLRKISEVADKIKENTSKLQ